MTHAPAPLDVSALGVRVRVEFPDDAPAEFVEAARGAWAAAEAAGAEAPDRTVTLAPVSDAPQQLEQLSVSVTLQALVHRRGEMLLFHAAGAAAPDGSVIAFVGPSGRGKTTLSSALCREYGYVSDETVAIDSALHVHPYRKPLSVVTEKAPKRQVAPAELGLKGLPEASLILSALVLLERDPEAPTPEVSAVSLPDAIEDLVPQMSYFSDLDRPLQRLAALSDAIGGFMRLRYAEAKTVVPLVPSLIARDPHPRTWSSCIDWAPGTLRTDAVDAIRYDEKVVVLVDRVVRVLTGIAPEIWDAARRGADRDGIVAHVVDTHGEPSGHNAAELVDAAIADLVESGVLTPVTP